MTVTTSAILEQLQASGCLGFAVSFLERHAVKGKGAHVVGRMRLDVLPYLHAHPSFRPGPALLHGDDVGKPRLEFRSERSAFGKDTSLQVVVNLRDGRFYADLDRFSPYDGIAGFLKHNLIEVWWPRLRDK